MIDRLQAGRAGFVVGSTGERERESEFICLVNLENVCVLCARVRLSYRYVGAEMGWDLPEIRRRSVLGIAGGKSFF